MRSLLFVPADQPRKLQKSLTSGADALILDLEDSVAPERKEAARRQVGEFLTGLKLLSGLPKILVRINPLDSGLAEADLDAVMPHAPAGIVLPKSRTSRRADATYAAPYELARTLTLLGARAAGVEPVDTVFTDFRDEAGLHAECEAARRDGFTCKLAIHPSQIPVINETFTPSAEAVARARAIVDAFFMQDGAGVISLDGQMLDRPHLLRAQGILARVARHSG